MNKSSLKVTLSPLSAASDTRARIPKAFSTRVGALPIGLLASALLLSIPNQARAQSICPAVPNTLSNGTTADASLVMGDFNYLVGCANGTASLASSGYQKLASGLIIQWTQINIPAAAVNSGASGSFTWPVTFPHAVLSVQVNQWNGGAWTMPSTQGNTLSGGTVAAWNLAGTPGTSIPYSIMGIGY